MPRANAMVPPDAIRIEDEVWQEAFTRREPARPSRERRIRAIERDYGDWLHETTGKALADAASWSVPRRASAESVSSTRPAVETEARVPAVIELADPAPMASEPSIAVPLVASPQPIHAEPARPDAPPARRTVKIQGRGAERNLPWPDSSRRRPPRRAYERHGFRPDRVAMWAVVLGFLLVLIAIVSAHA